MDTQNNQNDEINNIIVYDANALDTANNNTITNEINPPIIDDYEILEVGP